MAFQFGMADMVYGGEVIGCIQNASVDFSFNTAMLYCGNAIFPADVRTHTGTISGSAEFADLTATAFEKLLGGTRTGSSIELTSVSKPTTFQLVISLTTDGIPLVLTFNKVRSTKLALQFARDGHLIPNFDFSCEADANGTVATLDIGDVS
jgi:hypothetical protein